MSNKKKYNYRRITINFDMDDPADESLMKWLEDHKTKNNNYSNQIRKALKAYIKQASENS